MHADDSPRRFRPRQVYSLGRRTVSRGEIVAFARLSPALSRPVFSSDDNWPDVREAERDELRGYFDRMLEPLQHLGYPWSMLSQESRSGADLSDEGCRDAQLPPLPLPLRPAR